MIFSTENKTEMSAYFDSMSDAADFLENKMCDSARNSVSINTYWQGGTVEDCVNMLRNGNTSALEHYKKLDASLPDGILPPRTSEQGIYYDVAGASIDIGAYMQGTTECMLEFNQRESIRLVDIYISISYQPDTDSDEVTLKSMYITKLIDLLEMQGYRCAIHIGDYSETLSGKSHASVWVKVKDHKEALDISSVLCSSSLMFLRVLKLGVLQHLIDKYGLPFDRCYAGHSRSYDAFHKDTPTLPGNALYISSLRSSFDKSFVYRSDLGNFNQFAKHYLSKLPDNQ